MRDRANLGLKKRTSLHLPQSYDFHASSFKPEVQNHFDSAATFVLSRANSDAPVVLRKTVHDQSLDEKFPHQQQVGGQLKSRLPDPVPFLHAVAE